MITNLNSQPLDQLTLMPQVIFQQNSKRGLPVPVLIVQLDAPTKSPMFLILMLKPIVKSVLSTQSMPSFSFPKMLLLLELLLLLLFCLLLLLLP